MDLDIGAASNFDKDRLKPHALRRASMQKIVVQKAVKDSPSFGF